MADRPDAPPPPPPPSVSGLRPITFELLNEGARLAGHGRELVIDGDLIFVADAKGLPVMRWDGAGSLTLLHPLQAEATGHCSSLALHARSRTLLCTAADREGLMALIDVSDPTAPVARPWPPSSPPLGNISVPDVAVDGDTAWLAAQHLGLLRAPIGPDGTPGDLEAIPIGARVVQVAVSGRRVIVLDRVEGLVVLDTETLARLGSAALDGPPVDLWVAGDRVAVSLGSEGVRVLELDASGRPRPLVSVQPRCVATGAALEGDLLAVTCLSGVTLYDLSDAAPRVAGFVPSRYGMLDVAFTPFGLVVADWFRIDVLSTHGDGLATIPDAPRGMRLAPAADARIPVRNPGDVELEVFWALEANDRRRRYATGTLTLGPGAQETLEIPYALLAEAGGVRQRADVVFESASLDLESRTRIWHRSVDDEPARGRVAIGDPFPILARTSPSPAPDVLPARGEATLVMFLTIDCYLQWPQLEDLAWTLSRSTGAAVPTIFYLTWTNMDPFDRRVDLVPFGAESLAIVEWADYQGSVPGVETEPVPLHAFEASFRIDLPGADYPHDYTLDATGTVVATSRVYRGRWPLGE